MIRQGLLALTLPFAGGAMAEGLTLALPVDCTLGESCYIQQYMDRDPGPEFTDFHCSGLSYNGHKGTDFALPTRADMLEGINVLAAADGKVRGFRDGMADSGYSKKTADKVKGRECGNGVVLVHPNGWETQYCHLKNGSITVTNGQQVKAGDPLGQIGQSGRAQFPHLHLSVRKDGKPVDPFDPDGALTCNTPGDSTLWAQTPGYQPGAIVDIGFSDRIPEYDEVKAGTAKQRALSADARALVIYGFSFGTQPADVIRLSIAGPKGTLISKDTVMKRKQAQAFRAVGKRLRAREWPSGTYTGTATLIRNGQTVNTISTQIEVGGTE